MYTCSNKLHTFQRRYHSHMKTFKAQIKQCVCSESIPTDPAFAPMSSYTSLDHSMPKKTQRTAWEGGYIRTSPSRSSPLHGSGGESIELVRDQQPQRILAVQNKFPIHREACGEIRMASTLGAIHHLCISCILLWVSLCLDFVLPLSPSQ